MGLGIKYLLRSAIKTSPYNISKRSVAILGIETSCDDTGCAIVDDKGRIFGESLQSQQDLHLEHGGIMPPVARDLHKAAIQSVVDKALENANMKLADVDAIATTLKPGMALSLVVGMRYGKHLSKLSKKPFIPVHHMEAHALTIRMIEKVPFPFVVLLVSGGHCLLAIAQTATHFQLLGQSLDDAPGEAFDKISRRLKMRNISEFRSMSGGQAVEVAASRGNHKEFPVNIPMRAHRDCDFSFSGFKTAINNLIFKQEEKYEVVGGQTLPEQVIYDICASAQHGITSHIVQRLQRAIEFIRLKNLVPQDRQNVVMSGGVACNKYIQKAVSIVSRELDYKMHVPPPHLCTDNGVMIAWNGVERWQTQTGIYQHDNLDGLDIQPKCPLGEDISKEVQNANIKGNWIKWEKISNSNDENAAAFNSTTS